MEWRGAKFCRVSILTLSSPFSGPLSAPLPLSRLNLLDGMARGDSDKYPIYETKLHFLGFFDIPWRYLGFVGILLYSYVDLMGFFCFFVGFCGITFWFLGFLSISFRIYPIISDMARLHQGWCVLQIVLLQNIAPRIVSEAGGVSGVKNRKLSLADPTLVNLCSLGSATQSIY